MRFTFTERSFDTQAGVRSAMVITPATHARYGAADLVQLPSTPAISEVDAEILEQARARAGRVQLVVLRGMSDDEEGSWGFDEDVDPQTAYEIARRLLPSHTRVYRGLAAMGMFLFVHVEWGVMEVDAFRVATEERVGDLEAMGDRRSPVDELDLWILRNLVFYFGLSFDKLIHSVLPEKLVLMEKRIDKIRQLAREANET